MKICNHCKIDKEINQFNKNEKSKDGHRNECRTCHSEQNKKWRLKDPERWNKQSREWKHNNKSVVLETTKKWQRKQRELNSDYCIAHSLRTRLNISLRSGYRAGSAVSDLGCTIEEFRNYIESKFLPGMSWGNRGRWGIDKWHIDHIKPLAKFDLTNRGQFMEACNYKNMQPMWSIDNNIKADK